MSSIRLDIVTPTKILDEGEVTYVRCPGLDGLFGVMTGHIDGLFALDLGEIKVTNAKKDYYFATSGGFADVTSDRIQLLLETIERSSEIDEKRAEASLNRAQERLASMDEIDIVRVKASLTRATVRLKVANR